MSVHLLFRLCCLPGMLYLSGCNKQTAQHTPEVGSPAMVLKSESGQILGQFENVTLHHHGTSGALSQIQVPAAAVESLRSITEANTGKAVEIYLDEKAVTRATIMTPIESGMIGITSSELDSTSFYETEEEAVQHLINAHKD